MRTIVGRPTLEGAHEILDEVLAALWAGKAVHHGQAT